MSDVFSLHQRDIWVFGGAGYLGRKVVGMLAELGARVLCVDLEGRAAEMVAEAQLEPQVTAASLDASDISALEAFVEEQVRLRGVPHGLVMMTYASTAKRFDELTAMDFDQANHGNLTATLMLSRAVGQHMASQGRGSLVLFSSMYGSVSPNPQVYAAPMNPNPIEYGVGKAGMLQMARYLAVHFGKKNVRVNCVAPGPFPNAKLQDENPAFIERLTEKVPLGRVGRAEEIAGAVAFLLGDASTFITGQNIAVDGGWTIW